MALVEKERGTNPSLNTLLSVLIRAARKAVTFEGRSDKAVTLWAMVRMKPGLGGLRVGGQSCRNKVSGA